MFPSPIAEPLGHLDAAIHGLGDLDGGVLTNKTFSGLITELDLRQRRLDGAVTGLLAAWDDRGAWSDDGHRSGATWLADHTQASRPKAHRRLKTAQRLKTCPHTESALAMGTITIDHAETIAMARLKLDDVFDDIEPILVEAAKHLQPTDVAGLIAEIVDQLADDPTDDTPRAEPTNKVFLSRTIDGQWELSGTLNAETGATLHAAIEQIAGRLYEIDQRTEDATDLPARIPARRRADALGEIAALALALHHTAAPAEATTGHESDPPAEPDPAPNADVTDPTTNPTAADLPGNREHGGAGPASPEPADDASPADAGIGAPAPPADETDTDEAGTDETAETADGNPTAPATPFGARDRAGRRRGLWLPGLEPEGRPDTEAGDGLDEMDPAIKIGGSWIAEIEVVIPWSVLAGHYDNTEGPARICGIPISAAKARQLACDANICRIVTGPNSEPLDVGRSQRTANRAIRRAVRLRDGHCAFPGCDIPFAWCDLHHVIFWADHGETAVENLVALCSHHHGAIHVQGFGVRIDPDTQVPRFSRPDGTPITPKPEPDDFARRLRADCPRRDRDPDDDLLSRATATTARLPAEADPARRLIDTS